MRRGHHAARRARLWPARPCRHAGHHSPPASPTSPDVVAPPSPKGRPGSGRAAHISGISLFDATDDARSPESANQPVITTSPAPLKGVRMHAARLLIAAGILLGTLLAGSVAEAAEAYTVVDLGTLGGSFGEARGINSSGQVVGYSTTADGLARAFIWD